MNLTLEEKGKFADYLEFTALQEEGMLEHLKTLPGMDNMIKLKKVEILAFKIVEKNLRDWEKG